MPDIKLNEFQDWIPNVLDGTKPPDPPKPVIALFGYLNDADTLLDAAGNPDNNPTHRTRYRLYLTIQLDEYLVVQKADILAYHVTSEGMFSPLGGMLLWVKADAKLQYVNTRTGQLDVQASFLRGAISGGFSQGGGGGGATLACNTGGNTLACNTGGNTLACNTGGNTLACNTGGNTLACNTGGNTLACNTGGVSFFGCR